MSRGQNTGKVKNHSAKSHSLVICIINYIESNQNLLMAFESNFHYPTRLEQIGKFIKKEDSGRYKRIESILKIIV